MTNKTLGEIVALGRTSDIHAWGDNQVVKLYHNWFQFEWIKNEAKRTAVINQLPLASPKVGELLKLNGRNGLVFERLYGKNMLELVQADPTLISDFANRVATLQLEMHQLDQQPAIRRQKDKLEENLGRPSPLPDNYKAILLEQLRNMPDGESLCHGDFHPGNIVVTAERDVIVDWNDCSIGNPLADLARSTILFIGGITGNEEPNPDFEAQVTKFHDLYLDRYFELYAPNEADRAAAKAEYEAWIPIIAGARLCEGITSLEPWLLSVATKSSQ